MCAESQAEPAVPPQPIHLSGVGISLFCVLCDVWGLIVSLARLYYHNRCDVLHRISVLPYRRADSRTA